MCFTLNINVEYPEFARDKGGLEFNELVEILDRLSRPLADDGVAEAFRHFDIRTCGYMSAEDLARAVWVLGDDYMTVRQCDFEYFYLFFNQRVIYSI